MNEGRDGSPQAGDPSEDAAVSPTPSPPAVQPGQVWWCDGIALAFDPYFKRRPVLIVAVEGDNAHVIPLSSKRHYGQETAVPHDRGVSYMTGTVRAVPLTALRKPLGVWQDFPVWLEGQQTDPKPQNSLWQSLVGLARKIQKRVQRWFSRIDTLV